MSRFTIPSRDAAPVGSQPTLDAVGQQLGFIPNIHRLMSISPAVLTGFVGLQESLSKTLDLNIRDAIALAVSEVNGCSYCLASHSYVAGTFAKIPREEIALNRQGESNDAKTGAAARFAAKLVEVRGRVSDADLGAVRQAGFTDPQILEIVALSTQYLMTNFMNNVAGTEIDFPLFERAETT
jgi:uncharacterized peroxidase-related enzyme